LGCFQGWNAPLDQKVAAAGVRDDRGARKETIAPGMIRMVMGIDHITYGDIQFMFDKFTDAQRLIRQSQRIDHNGPLRAGYHACCHLSIHFTLEPKNVFRNSFAMHSALKFFSIDSTNTSENQVD
jgi:hypothetical protein